METVRANPAPQISGGLQNGEMPFFPVECVCIHRHLPARGRRPFRFLAVKYRQYDVKMLSLDSRNDIMESRETEV